MKACCCECAAELARLKNLLFVPSAGVDGAVCAPSGFDAGKLPDPKRVGEIVAENERLRAHVYTLGEDAQNLAIDAAYERVLRDRYRTAFLRLAYRTREMRYESNSGWGDMLDAFRSDRDRYRDEYESLCKIATGWEEKATRLAAEVERLRAALTDIVRHVEIVAPGVPSAVASIARRALEVPRAD